MYAYSYSVGCVCSEANEAQILQTSHSCRGPLKVVYLTVLIPKELQALDLCPTHKSTKNIPLNMPLNAKGISIKRACGIEEAKEAQTLSHREKRHSTKPS